MDVEITRMSSKGQVVVPMGMRKKLGAGEGTLFAVVGTADGLVLRKIQAPSKSELLGSIKEMAKEAEAVLKAEGFGEKDIVLAAARARGR
jgi:AbrB family looped-hinge helix DNA binding protein